MFDAYVTRSREYVPYDKTVTVNRAPTDESIKLWEEMKEKAYKSIIHKIQISDNVVNGKAIVYNDIPSMDEACMYEVVVNGRKFEGKFVVEWNPKADRFKDEMRWDGELLFVSGLLRIWQGRYL